MTVIDQAPIVVGAPRIALAAYPVHFGVTRSDRFTRMQLLIRFAVFIVLGAFGMSFATVFAFAYLALPVYAAARIGAMGSARDYAREDGLRVASLLKWLASVSAWVGLVTDRLPAYGPDETVSLTLDATTPRSTAGQMLLRVFQGLPSALALMLLCWIGVFVWLWAALTILIGERVGPRAFAYLVGLQRWSVRLLAYQAGLVDAYPPFTLSDPQPSDAPSRTSRAP